VIAWNFLRRKKLWNKHAHRIAWRQIACQTGKKKLPGQFDAVEVVAASRLRRRVLLVYSPRAVGVVATILGDAVKSKTWRDMETSS
jgi:hypothetical protein